jgi:hypothetical protein
MRNGKGSCPRNLSDKFRKNYAAIQWVPSPGSEAAIKKGCKCPVLDNGRGRGLGNGHYWISGNCPLHGKKK